MAHHLGVAHRSLILFQALTQGNNVNYQSLLELTNESRRKMKGLTCAFRKQMGFVVIATKSAAAALVELSLTAAQVGAGNISFFQ